MTQELLIENIKWVIIIATLLGIITIIKWICRLIKNIILGIGRTSKKAASKIYRQGYSSTRSKNRKSDLDRIFLSCKMHINLPKTEYIPQNPIYLNFLYSPYRTDNLNTYMQQILNYINYQGKLPEISYAPLLNDMSNHYFNRQRAEIKINTRIENPQILAALVVRECIRLYMFENHINYSPEYLPEQNVDVYALYLGFYKVLMQGYQNIGALNAGDMKYIRKQIKKYRK